MAEPKEGDYRREIEILEERLAKLKKALGTAEGREAPPEKELLREAIGERIREALPPPPFVPPSPPAVGAPTGASAHDEVEEVEPFVTIALSADIPRAVKAVLKSGNAHLIDAFHDVLVDRFYDELVKLGKLK